MEETLLSVAEAADKLHVSPRTIQRYCKQGRLAHKWVMGKRHKELRVVSPIPLSEIPGGRRRTPFAALDESQREQIEGLRAEVADLRDRLDHLEGGHAAGDASGATDDAIPPYLLDRIREMIDEYENVRPAEKKLILKLAREIRDHEDYLVSVGKSPAGQPPVEDR